MEIGSPAKCVDKSLMPSRMSYAQGREGCRKFATEPVLKSSYGQRGGGDENLNANRSAVLHWMDGLDDEEG